MTKDEALRLALEALEDLGMKHYENTGEVLYKETFTAIKAALEANDEKDGSPCPEFWDWLPKAYRNGDADDLPKFTKYNMEVSFLAGKQSAALEAKDEPVAWRDAAIRLGEELSSVGPNGYYSMSAKEWLDWAMEQNPRGKYSLPQRKPLSDEEIKALDYSGTRIEFVRAIEAAHGIKGEA